jgi:hypothetical protein
LLRNCSCAAPFAVVASVQPADLAFPSIKNPPPPLYAAPLPWEFEFGARNWFSTGY